MDQKQTSLFSARCSRWQDVALRHGCVFDNLRFVEDDAGSVRVMAINLDCPVLLRIPNEFIIPLKGVGLTNQGQRVLPNYCHDDEVRAVIDDMLAYIMSSERLDALRTLFIDFSELPTVLRDKLCGYGLVTQLIMKSVAEVLRDKKLESSQDFLPWVEPDNEALRHRLLKSRLISRADKELVFMPFVDFINHDPSGLSYQTDENTIGVCGAASSSGEVFALYNYSDAWGLLDSYGYVGRSSFAYSVAFELGMPDARRLRINRRTGGVRMDDAGLRLPNIDKDGQTISLSHVWIGALGAQEQPFRSFAKVWATLGRDDALVVFGEIVRYNWIVMRELRHLVGSLDTPAANMLRGTLSQHMQILAEQSVG